MIQPEAFRSRDLAKVDPAIRWTFAGLWTLADDQGTALDDPEAISADLYLRDPDITPYVVEDHLAQLAKAGVICRFTLGGHRYLHMPTWSKHQTINRPSAPRYPACDLDHTEQEGTLFPTSAGGNSVRTQGALTEGSSLREVKRSKKTTSPDGGSPLTRRALVITRRVHEQDNMIKFVAVQQLAKTAISKDRWSDDEITTALLALVAENRPITQETLRIRLTQTKPNDDHQPPWRHT
jgi:hypothetical protein